MFESIESLCEKIRSVLGSGDMRSAHCLGTDEIMDEMPSNVDMLRPTVKDWGFG